MRKLNRGNLTHSLLPIITFNFPHCHIYKDHTKIRFGWGEDWKKIVFKICLIVKTNSNSIDIY